MKKTLLAIALSSATFVSSAPLMAQESPFSSNVGLFSDYRFRGLTQSDTKPALQGGFDYANANGFYAGNWNSSIGFTDAGIESDFYFGYATELGGVGIDVGNLYYYYPGATAGDTNEIYLGLSAGPASFKVSYATSDYFGVDDSKGHIYYNLGVSIPVSDKVTIDGSMGYHAGKGAQAKGYDYLVGISVDVGNGFALGVSYVTTSGDLKPSADDKGAVISISRSF